MDTFLSFVIAFSLSLSLLSGTVMVVSSLVIYYTQKRYGFAGFAMMALGIILINIMFLNKAEFKDFKLGVSVADTITSLNGKQIDNRAIIEGLQATVDKLISTLPSESQEKFKKFNKNSQYRVIIFYKDRSALADAIKTSLLNQGYL